MHTPHIHPQRSDVLVERTEDGPDFTLICERHQWASLPVDAMRAVDWNYCPKCQAEQVMAKGQRRYRELMERM